MLKKNDHYVIAGLGVEFTLIMCIGFFGGRWLDKYFGTEPWLLLLSCALAFALAIYVLVKSARIAAGKESPPARPQDKK